MKVIDKNKQKFDRKQLMLILDLVPLTNGVNL